MNKSGTGKISEITKYTLMIIPNCYYGFVKGKVENNHELLM